MKRILLTLGMMVVVSANSFHATAQRKTDVLGRGLVAVKKSNNVFLSWRITAEEYYDVTYNLYCNGSKIASNLRVSNYNHTAGNSTSR